MESHSEKVLTAKLKNMSYEEVHQYAGRVGLVIHDHCGKGLMISKIIKHANNKPMLAEEYFKNRSNAKPKIVKQPEVLSGRLYQSKGLYRVLHIATNPIDNEKMVVCVKTKELGEIVCFPEEYFLNRFVLMKG